MEKALAAVKEAAAGDSNIMPSIIQACSVYCTEQEICDVLRDVMGRHTDSTEF